MRFAASPATPPDERSWPNFSAAIRPMGPFGRRVRKRILALLRGEPRSRDLN